MQNKNMDVIVTAEGLKTPNLCFLASEFVVATEMYSD